MADKESRTEEPTDKKKSDARLEGNIAKSQDLASWAAMLGCALVLQSTVVNGGRFLTEMMNEVSLLVGNPDQAMAMNFFKESLFESAKILAPVVGVFSAVAILGHFVQVRFVLAWKAMKPSFKKMNPINGFKRMFGKQAYFNMFKEVAKTVVLGAVAYYLLWDTMSHISQNNHSLGDIITLTAGLAMEFVKWVAVLGFVIGVADYFYQRHTTNSQMKMSKDEVKQEHKSSEGSPEMKGQIRAKQRAMSRNRMMANIKDADVVIVNPVHVAVALRYDPAKGAPMVLAKGAGFVAEKIREKADEHKIPMIQDIPLARTMHRVCEVDEEIPMEMFEAVAKLLAFVFGLKNKGRAHGFHKMPGTPELAEYERDEAKREAEEARTAGAAGTVDPRVAEAAELLGV